MEEPRRLGGRYELGSVLGRGGMAEVYLAHDTRLGRTVAVKTLRVDLARDPSFQARFRREAQSAASLNHPAIVAVYDTGEDYVDQVSIPYIVMEYVDGSTLRELLHSGRKLLPERAMEMCIGILQALEYSHRNGIVHRDIKPANVMLTRNGQVKVMDFGIARAMGDSGMTMTQTAAVIGTAQYLSPEQAKGEQVDARSDLYSTGCLLYELLTVRPPFVGDSPVAVAYQHVREEPTPPSAFDPEITPGQDAIVMRALVKDPDYRYQSADEMRADIEASLDGQPVAATAAMGSVGYASGGGYSDHDDRPTTALRTQDARTSMLPPMRDDDGGYYDEDGRGGRRGGKKSSTSTILLIVALVLVLIGAIFMGQVIFGGNNDDATFEMPSLAGQSYADAQSAAEGRGLEVQKGQAEYCEQEKKTVCKTDPAEGDQVTEGDTITIIMSKGPAPLEVPDVDGDDYDAAEEELQEAGFEVKRVDEESDEEVGTVLGQDPAGGSKADRGATITLTVAKESLTTVPDVVGKPYDQAASQLQQNGFEVARKEKDSPGTPADQVIEQSSTGQAAPGSTIVLTVAKAPATPQPTAVPDVRNKAVKDAKAELEGAGFSVQVQGSTDPKAKVVNTNPAPGTQAPQGSVVTLYAAPNPGGDNGGFFGGPGGDRRGDDD
ncbi:Stk1 family PASTA domain-containing Ser/Thr kinase [Streptomyces sp. RKND-216]|uniref:Stk1 family PASTA domain-containing Ser/Thr kinase n=1 Tax=Streptomyces sp. RKND-216 TaxID=2562581 RepID=UPI00109E062E|nr:Stk1 family PASTA domain-containing Ser/Thr kinase [Streptomyces sp. RKND-216]THA25446.1 Stk1 family PASTA domain-containing Ser/Thr kinase [Streptomyces sp. RKND-216]